jgi:hypothetical protein
MEMINYRVILDDFVYGVDDETVSEIFFFVRL